MTEFLLAAWAITLELAPWLLLGAVIAGVLHVALPPGFVKRAFVGRRGVLTAVALGVPLPLCSCGVIPAGLGLKKDGASDGAAVGFLISTPQTGVDSVLVSASFLGWPFAIFKLLAAGLTGLVGGWITDAVTTEQSAGEAPKACSKSEPPKQRTLGAAWAHAVDVLRSIWKWLAFGVLLSAFITTVLPPSWLASVGGDNHLLALGLALLISVPLYVCATASVPIAAALVAGGLPAGAALVFLMAGPATNLATLGAVYRTLGRKAVTVYLGTIVIGSVVLAYAFDALFPLSITAPHHHVHEASLIAQATAAALMGMMVWFAADDLRAWRSKPSAATGPVAVVVGVEGMSCQGCVRKLTRLLGEDERIETCTVELDPGSATVQGTLDRDALAELVRKAGYTPVDAP